MWLPHPPYPWYIPMGSVPTFHIFLDGPTAINTGIALGVLVAFFAFIGVVLGATTGGLAAALVVLLGIIIGVSYVGMYSADHASDNSFHLWVPYDWYNLLCVGWGQIYMATRRYWWIGTLLGAYIVGSR